MNIDPRQISATVERYQARRIYRSRNERLIDEGRYLEVDSPDRVMKFLNRRGYSTTYAGEVFRDTPAAGSSPLASEGGSEVEDLERILGTNDMVGVAFLEQGLQVAHSVGRVWIGITGGQPIGYGTGFLISPRLLLTNNHVLPSSAVARKSLIEMNYQLGLNGAFLPTTTFVLDPDVFFFTDVHLDYAVSAVQRTGGGGGQLTAFGWNTLIEEEGKAIISQWLNIIQHPNGEAKQLGLRENQLVDVMEEFLHYKTDTAPGSSGSPVYNDRWEVVGLHHSGVPDKNAAGQVLAIDGRVWQPSMGEHRIKWISNEGIRISRLLAHLRRQPMTQEQRRLFEEVFTAPVAVDQPHERGTSAIAEAQNANATISADGTASWTIPISVSVRIGNVPAVQAVGQPSTATAPPATTTDGKATAPPAGPDEILNAAKREFSKRSDVLRVRLGYVFKDGWITDQRAIVVTVRRKQSLSNLREAGVPALPTSFQGMPIQVTNPTIEDLVRMTRGPAVAIEAFSDAAVLAEEITYVPPAGAPLTKVSDNMKVVAHVSPDNGWPQLEQFLAGTQKRLVVAMYDFGAPHIADAVQQAGEKPGFTHMTLVMQPGESVGEGTKVDDLTDGEVVQRLGDALDNKFENAWVKIGKVNGWVASSYHIKVCVRDRKAFWLSSGNWQSSNQPNADPLNEQPQKRTWLTKYNRDWHAIVEHAALAKTFEAYILDDFQHNVGNPGEEVLGLPDVLLPISFFVAGLGEEAAAFKYFAPFVDHRQFTVTPLLTPDNYHEHVLELVNSATDELLIQNQTFNAPKPAHDQLRELMNAVLAKQQAGVKVRVIFRVLIAAQARETLEALKEFGFDDRTIRVQKNCHTKGVIVDRKRVMLGSQNWSNDGVSVNRDASLLFEDAPLAEYFGEIFDHDWDHLAKQDIGPESMMIEPAGPNEATPPGMVRLSWKDYMEML
jgi:V8-like Glu-specific endopeptidase